MVSYTLVIILMAYPLSQNGGLGSSIVVPGFTTEQACLNAARKIRLPDSPTDWLDQKNSITCVATSV